MIRQIQGEGKLYENGPFSARFISDSGREEYTVELMGKMNHERCQTHEAFYRVFQSETSLDWPLTLDFKDLEEIDCSGVADVVMAVKPRIRGGAKTTFTGMRDNVRDAFSLYVKDVVSLCNLVE